MNLGTSVQYLKGVGEKRAAVLRRLGIVTLGDLLAHVPRAYEDWQNIVSINDALPGELCCVSAIVNHAPTEHMIRAGMTLYKTRATDGSGVVNITIFNSGFIAEKLREGEAYLFYGKMGGNLTSREMSSPQIAPANETRLRPVYPLTEGISSKQLEALIEKAFAQIEKQVKDFLPDKLLQKYELMPRLDALQAIHRPESLEQAAHARKRLAFNELFILQLGLRLLKQGRANVQAHALKPTKFDLPFTPTGAQLRAIEEAAQDLAKTKPMFRLLQGDVGSGKTAVAAALLHQAAKNGCQAAMMAPTELLARQHHATLANLGLNAALLIGSTPAAQKKKLKEELKSGAQKLVVGTHALLEQDVSFAKLALVIVDEQHRFGVEQRDKLTADHPHVYIMSATPIPRSLALIIYGDLDISVLDELPPGRTPVETYAIGSSIRTRAYHYIKKHLDAGQQAYIVCPRVDENESSELASAKEFYSKLSQQDFAGYSLGLLHGKLKPKAKDQVMQDFATNKVQLLVATTVIEVGVDVPNAVIMIIENAERFGLSQLHQLRGRVGRGAGKSTCILISDAENEEALSRFETMKATSDGFEIARHDLQQRGPGEFFGARQHGLPPFKIADIATDSELLRISKQAADAIIKKDPALEQAEHQALKKACEKLFRD